MNDNSLPINPTVEDHVVPPAFTPPPPPPTINPTPPPTSPTNKKPGKPKIIAAVIAGLVLVVGLAAGVYLNSRSQPTRVDTSAAPCAPVGIVEKYCDTSSGSEVEAYHTCGQNNEWQSGGSGLSCSPCGSLTNPNDNSTCTNASPPGPGGGGISCQQISTDQNHLAIQINNGANTDKTYQLQKCFCPGGELPCNACDFSLPSVLANSQKTEELDMPGACGSIQLDVSPVDNEFGACFAWHTTNVACTTPKPVCTNLTLSSSTLTPGQSITATSTAQSNATTFTYALFNVDNPSASGPPNPICVTSGGDVTDIVDLCPTGTYRLIYKDPNTALRTTGTRNLTYANIFVADQKNGGAVAQRVQINAYIADGGPTSTGVAACAKIVTVASVPTATIPVNNPTPTTIPVTTCQQLEMYRAGVRITPDQIRRGDVLTLRGFASAVNTTVSQIRFRITIGGTAQTLVLVPATLQSGVYQAEHQITINTATTYSITVEPVSP